MKDVFKYLKEKNLKIAFAESMTGGKLSSLITKNSGASKVFSGAVVAYNNDVKINLLNVSSKTIKKYSVVSKEVALEMVNGLKDLINANIYISVTGNAGPSLEKNTTEFECYIKMFYKNEYYDASIIFDNNDRLENINQTVNLIKDLILNFI